VSKKPGRNDPCPCGSGKKYKVCHAAEDRVRAAHTSQARTGDLESLIQYAEKHPELSARITQEAKERAARVEAALRLPSTPSVFSPEEQIWLTCVLWHPLQALKAPGLDAEARRETVKRFLQATTSLVDASFLTPLLERLRAQSHDASLPEETRAFFTDAAVAFEAEPVRMVLAAVLTSRNEPTPRSAEEHLALADLEAHTRWTPEQLEPYRQLLERMGLTLAAERIRRSQDWLREHPVSLPASPG
jgi:hypothetical protein